MRGVEAECREQTAYCFKCSELRPASVRGERRQDQRAKERIDLRRSQRAAALDPPIQHQNERGRDVLDEEIRWNLDACVSSRRRAALYMAGDQLSSGLFWTLRSDSGRIVAKREIAPIVGYFSFRGDS